MLLFKDLMESVVWWKKGAMKTTVRRALIPLLFRMSDETQSVAKVQISHLAVDVGTGCADTRGVFWAWGGAGQQAIRHFRDVCAVPSPCLCFSTGLCSSPTCLCKVPEVETA